MYLFLNELCQFLFSWAMEFQDSVFPDCPHILFHCSAQVYQMPLHTFCPSFRWPPPPPENGLSVAPSELPICFGEASWGVCPTSVTSPKYPDTSEFPLPWLHPWLHPLPSNLGAYGRLTVFLPSSGRPWRTAGWHSIPQRTFKLDMIHSLLFVCRKIDKRSLSQDRNRSQREQQWLRGVGCPTKSREKVGNGHWPPVHPHAFHTFAHIVSGKYFRENRSSCI